MDTNVGRLVYPIPTDTMRPEFDEALYLTLNPDVAEAIAAGQVASARAHWDRHGRQEERLDQRPTIRQDAHYRVRPGHMADPPSRQELLGFDAAAYLAAYPDVRAQTNGDPALALDHWIRHGRFEGRVVGVATGLRTRQVLPARLLARPMGVNFYAPFSARSGLGTAARGYLRALRCAGIPVDLIDLDLSTGAPRVTAAAYDRPPRYRVNLMQVNADTMARFAALFRPDRFDDAYNIGIWAWELNILRPDWHESFGLVDEVWTLSRHNQDAVQPMAPVPVLTIGPPVQPHPAALAERAHFALPEGFLFLTALDVGSALPRKNPGAVVDAFLDAFAGRADVHLLIKMHAAIHDLAGTQRLLQKVHRHANIQVRSGTLPEEEMRALQACADCLVSAHRAEGFGLNLAELMAAGKPVIATGASGNLDFMDAANAYLVPSRPVMIRTASGPYLPGYTWHEPDREALAALMRQVVDDPRRARETGLRAAATIRANYSAEAIGDRIAARFAALELDRRPPEYMAMLGRTAGMPVPDPALVTPLGTTAELEARPVISVVVPVFDTPPEYLSACIASVRDQTWPHWELCLCDDGSVRTDTRAVLAAVKGTDPRIRVRTLERNAGIAAASNAAASMASGFWLLMLDHDDTLAPDALAEIAAAVIRDPTLDALYADEDKLDPDGVRCDPSFKPGWSPELLESVMYTLHPLTVRREVFLELGGFRTEMSGAQDWDLMLRIARRDGRIHHVPKLLYHWRMMPGSAAAQVDAKPAALEAGARALADHVAAKHGPDARVEPGALPGHFRVRRPVRGRPPVTLVVPASHRTLSLPGRKPFVIVQNLVRSIREHTAYPDARILVVDDADLPPRLQRWMDKQGVILRSFHRRTDGFNFSDKMNFALRQVETEQVVFLNDDMEATGPDWLDALLEFSQDPAIGAVGAKLLHDDGTIQHAGMVLGVGGGSAHVYHNYPGEFIGYGGFTHTIRNYSAVTGACLATRRSVVVEVGGWDPLLATDYNDVDLCLRMRMHGYRIVYTPYAVLRHFENSSIRRTAASPAEAELFRKRWAAEVADDPYYNPNLTRETLDFAPRR